MISFEISAEEQRLLLADARESIVSQLEGRKPQYRLDGHSEGLLQPAGPPCGAFVSLHKEAGGCRSLRGCIGRMTATEPLPETVRAMAREAAFGDPRFPPLGPAELERCRIEISVLSPMSPCPDPRQVKVGLHGLHLQKGARSGVLLPQVPVEQGWNLDQYLDYICVKAGLPPGSYNDPEAVLRIFTAIVFGE